MTSLWVLALHSSRIDKSAKQIFYQDFSPVRLQHDHEDDCKSVCEIWYDFNDRYQADWSPLLTGSFHDQLPRVISPIEIPAAFLKRSASSIWFVSMSYRGDCHQMLYILSIKVPPLSYLSKLISLSLRTPCLSCPPLTTPSHLKQFSNHLLARCQLAPQLY